MADPGARRQAPDPAGARRQTLEDVAAAAGVGRATVWRALNQPASVSKDASDKVARAVRAIGYYPDMVARAMRTDRSALIAIVVPAVEQSFYKAIQRASADASRAGFETVLGVTDYDAEAEYEIVGNMLGRRAPAMILAGNDQLPETGALLRRAEIPLVQIWEVEGPPLGAMIGFSNAAVGRAVARFLLGLGRRRVGLLYDPARPRARRRIAGLRSVLAEAGARPPAEPPGGLAGAGGVSRALEALFAAAPDVDAIYANGDQIALEAVHWLGATGRRVPGDVAVLGFGDDSFSAFVRPGISSVRVPDALIGARAIELLLGMIDGAPREPRAIDLGFEIVARETT